MRIELLAIVKIASERFTKNAPFMLLAMIALSLSLAFGTTSYAMRDLPSGFDQMKEAP